MADRTASEMVTLIDAAIAKIAETGIAYGIDGRTLTRADLSDLLKARSYYTTLANADESGTGGIITCGVVF